MGCVAFGKPYGTLQNGEDHPALKILYGAVHPFAVLGPIPWIFNAIGRLPGNPFQVFVKWCAEQVQERIQVSTSHTFYLEMLVRNISLRHMDRWRV